VAGVVLAIAASVPALAAERTRNYDGYVIDGVCSVHVKTVTGHDGLDQYGFARTEADPYCSSATAQIKWTNNGTLYTNTDFDNSGGGIYDQLANMSSSSIYYDTLHFSYHDAVSSWYNTFEDYWYSCACTDW